jgi:hypothetical protein
LAAGQFGRLKRGMWKTLSRDDEWRGEWWSGAEWMIKKRWRVWWSRGWIEWGEMFEEDWINEDYKKRREEGGEGGGEQGFGVWDFHGGWKILFQIGMKWGIIVIAYETLRPGLPHYETTGHCLVFCRLLLLCIYFDSKIK